MVLKPSLYQKAAAMPLEIQDFPLLAPGGGGANERVAGHLIDDTQSARPDASTLPLLNVHTNEVGEIVQRSGYSVYSGALTTTSYVTGLFQYKKFNGNEFEIVCGDNGSVKHIWDISSPGSPVDIIGAATVTSDSLFSFAVVADKLIITNDARDTVLKWTGTGNVASLGGTPPQGKFVKEFNNYCFMANTSANPERVYWSNLFDPETWTGTDFYRLNNACTGLARTQDSLFMFTIQGCVVARYTGDSLTPFTFDLIDSNVGCGAGHSLINAVGTIYWVGNDAHIYRMNGYTPERVSELIPTTISEMTAASLSRCVAVEHRELRQLWFYYPKDSSSTNNFVVAYDYLNNQFFFYDGMAGNSCANFQESNGALKTYFGDRTGRIYLTNTGNTDYVAGSSTSINAYRHTKMFNLGVPNRVKRFRKIRSTVNNNGSGSSTITVIGDFGANGGEVLTLNHNAGNSTIGAFIVGTTALGGQSDVKTSNDVSTTCNYIQLKIAHNQNSIPFKMRDLVMMFQNYGDTRL